MGAIEGVFDDLCEMSMMQDRLKERVSSESEVPSNVLAY